MNECLDKRIGMKLYAYEIELLDVAEREEFEIHLLECKYCNDRVQKFQTASDIIRHDDNIRDVVKDIDQEPIPPRKRFGGYFKAVIVAAAILVVLLLKPWRLEFQPTHEANAVENRLAVLQFKNLASPNDPARTGDIISDLLITDLSQSSYIDVVSFQRLQDIMNHIDRQTATAQSIDNVSKIAELTRANWIVSGEILQIEPNLMLTVHLTEIPTGKQTLSSRITAKTDEDIFALVDKITASIKKELALPSVAMEEFDRPVAEVTTHSREALFHYLEGTEFYSKAYFDDARRSFERALEYDSTLAMAYYYLAALDKPNSAELIEKASRYSDNLSGKDRLYIRSREASIDGSDSLAMQYLKDLLSKYPEDKEALRLLGNFEFKYTKITQAIALFEKAIEIDPYDIRAINNLIYMYDLAGEYDKAMEVIDDLTEITPDDANPYALKGKILAATGNLEQAIKSYKRAISIKPEFRDYKTMIALGRLQVFAGDYHAAREYFREVIIDGDRLARSSARTFMATVPLYQGKLGEAIKQLNDGIAADRMELAAAGINGDESYKHFIKARIHAERKEFSQALTELREAIRVHNTVFSSDRPAFRCMLAEILAESGDFNAADEIVDTLKKEYRSGEKPAQSAYWYAVGSIELIKGNYRKAAEGLEKCVQAGPYFEFKILLAKALFKAKKYEEAIELYDKLLIDYSSMYRLQQGIESVKAYYYLGVSYEKTGNISEAKKQYSKFLSLWHDGDIESMEIQDAQNRLDRLNGIVN